MDFDSISYFLRACELQSLTKASQELYITQPSMSRRILALEDELGVALLKRTSTGITMTEAGKVFYNEAKKLINSQTELMGKMKQFKTSHFGLLRIGCRWNVPLKPILIAAQLMKENYPDVEMKFEEMSYEDLLDNYVSGKLDIAYSYRYYLPKTRNTIIETIKKNDVTVLVPKGHRFWGAQSVTFSDLAGETFVITKRGQGAQEFTNQMLEENGVSLKDAIVCGSGTERLFKAAFGGYITIGGKYPNEISSEFSDLFHSIEIVNSGIDGADLCLAYRPSNSTASRFANFIIE